MFFSCVYAPFKLFFRGGCAKFICFPLSIHDITSNDIPYITKNPLYMAYYIERLCKCPNLRGIIIYNINFDRGIDDFIDKFGDKNTFYTY